MNVSESPVLEFPAMLYGTAGDIRRKVKAKGLAWAREYLKTGGFSLPRSMRQVLPGEVLIVNSGTALDSSSHPLWRIYMLPDAFMSLKYDGPKENRPLMEENFESFCLSTPWGALSNVVCPFPPKSAGRMAGRLAALLRFWDVLHGPRYAYFAWREFTLEELVEHVYGLTMEAWYPGGADSVREHLALTVERMARATREECIEAVLRVIPGLLKMDKHLEHRQTLSDSGFLRERLAALRPDDFENVSSAERFTVNGVLWDWARALGRNQTSTPGGAEEP